METLDRLVGSRVARALQDTPVVIVQGPRQAGKSTLVRDLLGEPMRYVTLDDLGARAAADRDPEGFLAGLPPQGVVIDEVQRVPELVLAIKAAVDRDRRPGRFLLTGSADVLSCSGARESLAGRTELVRLWPLAQAEMQRTAAPNPTDLFTASIDFSQIGPVEPQDIANRVARGGYPSGRFRSRCCGHQPPPNPRRPRRAPKHPCRGP